MATKFGNTMDYKALVAALKKWTTLTDGNDGATGFVEQEIPYPAELASVIPWEDVVEKFDTAIGPRREFDIGKILDGDSNEILSLDTWARNRASEIAKVYQEVIDRANSTSKYTLRVKALTGVINGMCQYETANIYRASTRKVCIDAFLNTYAGILVWDRDEFYDAMFGAATSGSSVHVGVQYYAEWA